MYKLVALLMILTIILIPQITPKTSLAFFKLFIINQLNAKVFSHNSNIINASLAYLKGLEITEIEESDMPMIL